MFGQVELVAPYDPATSSADETELVAGGVDGLDSGKLEVLDGRTQSLTEAW